MGFEPMTSVVPVRRSTDWAMKPHRKQVRCKFNLYLLYEENNLMWSVYDKDHEWTVDKEVMKSWEK